jgi:hypothetical protein
MLKTAMLLLLSAVAISLTSCDKDNDDNDNAAEELREKIAGTWDFTSFKLGGSEYMGTIVDSASIEYKTFTGTQGDFVQKVKYLDEDPLDTTAGKYQIVDGDEIKMTADGDSYTMKVTFSGNTVQLEGTQDGKQLIVKAKKRG